MGDYQPGLVSLFHRLRMRAIPELPLPGFTVSIHALAVGDYFIVLRKRLAFAIKDVTYDMILTRRFMGLLTVWCKLGDAMIFHFAKLEWGPYAPKGKTRSPRQSSFFTLRDKKEYWLVNPCKLSPASPPGPSILLSARKNQTRPGAQLITP